MNDLLKGLIYGLVISLITCTIVSLFFFANWTMKKLEALEQRPICICVEVEEHE